MKKVGLGFVILLLAIYVVAGPYITTMKMKGAAEAHDGEKLSEYVDFVSLRQSMKDQMNAMMLREMNKVSEDNPMAGFGAAFGGLMVDKMVDAYVTPDGLTEMMRGEKPNSGAAKAGSSSNRKNEPFKNATLSYESLNKFSISVTNLNSGETTKFILGRRGLGWKLIRVVMPM